jgi:hypothetical protein
MKYIIYTILVGVSVLIAHNGYQNIKAQEYKTCMITSTDKAICATLRD